MNQYTYVIKHDPFGKQRPRFGHGRVYTPKETVRYERFARLLYTGPKFEDGVSVTITAYFKEPRRCGLFPTKKPDADNIAKVILDALNGVAWDDDKQVVNLTVNKRWDKIARVVVSVGDAE